MEGSYSQTKGPNPGVGKVKAPVFAFGYAEAGKGTKGLSCVAEGEEGRSKSQKSTLKGRGFKNLIKRLKIGPKDIRSNFMPGYP